MDENRLEKHIRGKLSRYESLSDAETMWYAIQAKQNPKRRFAIYWLILAAGIIVLALGIYLYSIDSNPKLVSEQGAEISVLPNKKWNSGSTSNDYNQGEKFRLENIESDSKDISAIERDKQAFNINSISAENASKTLMDIPLKDNSFIIDARENKNSSKHRNIKPINGINQIANNREYRNDSHLSFNHQNIVSADQELDNNSETRIILPQISVLSNSIHELSVIEPFAINRLSPIQSRLHSERVANLSSSYSNLSPIGQKNNIDVSKIWKLAAGIQMAYQHPFGGLKPTSDTLTSHLYDRINSEESLDAYRVQLNLKLNYKQSFLQSGISFSNLTEKLYSSTLNEKSIFIDTTIHILIYKDSSEYQIIGMVEGIERTKTVSQRYNRYRTIDIPIMLGFEQTLRKSKWSYTVSGGAFINVNFLKSGYILSPEDNSLVSLQSLNDQNYWNERLGVRFMFTGGIKYHINQYSEFSMGPQFEFGGKSLTKKATGISQQYNNIGIQTGIFIQF